MSIFLSITTLFSLLSFLTTLLALVRVGSAAFLTNQLQHRIDFEVERANGSPQSPSPSSSSAVLAQAMAEMQMQMKMQIKGLGGHGQGMTVKGDNTAMGTELMRIPGGMNWSIRKGHSGRPREFECSNFGWCCVSDGRSLSFLLLCFYLFREMDGMI